MKLPVVFLLVAALTLAGRSMAQVDGVGIRSVAAWQGYLVDVRTAQEFLKNPGSAMKNASQYDRATALLPQNSGSGFGIFTEGTWLKFDTAGSTQAVDLIRNTKTEKGIMVVVTGILNGDELNVRSLKETLAVPTKNY